MKQYKPQQPISINIADVEPPHDVDCECKIIGTLLNEKTFFKFADFLNVEAFTDGKNAAAFTAITKAYTNGENTDVFSLANVADITPFANKNAAISYLTDLMSIEPLQERTFINSVKHLAELAAQRKAYNISATLLYNLQNGDVGELIDGAKNEFEKIIPSIINDDNDTEVWADDDIEDGEPVLMQGEKMIMSEGNISVITGQPKSRKTFLVSAIIVAYFKGYMGLCSQSVGRVLLFDTEQGKAHVVKERRRIHRMLNWDFHDHNKGLRIFPLRELTPIERLKKLERNIIKMKPKLVIIDGFADLLSDTNDIKESTARIGDLMRLSSKFNCHICSVIHTNPKSDKMRGHLGSEFERKVESGFMVTKCDDVTAISPVFCRNIDFNKFSFRIDEKGIPVACDYTPTAEDNNKVLLEKIFFGTDELSYSDLRTALMQQLNIKVAAAQNRITKGVQAGIIAKNTAGNYTLKYSDLDADDMPPEF